MAKRTGRAGKDPSTRKTSKPKGNKVPIAKYDPLGDKDGIEQYVHSDKTRPYNPPVGLVTPDTDKDAGKAKYSYDPHLDPQLQWAGKAERVSFEVDTVSLHVHERIDPLTIMENVVKKDQGPVQMTLFHYFEQPDQNPPLREAIHFYKHKQNWSNRLIAGDSLLVMNSLLQKEGMAGKVQMIYIDPPYGIKYGSNFQPFVNKRDVKDGKDEDLTQEPETVRAFRDTWELGIHSYLTYLRDRLLLARELLTESGSVFVQISDENLHHVRELMDEVFGAENFARLIIFQKTGGLVQQFLPRTCDLLIWYTKDRAQAKFRQLYLLRSSNPSDYQYVELATGERRSLTPEERNGQMPVPRGRLYSTTSLESANPTFAFTFANKTYHQRWKTNEQGLLRLAAANRLSAEGRTLRYVRFFEDFPVRELQDVWADTMGERDIVYVVQTNTTIVQRCLLMTTDPGDLVFDPTCGSGTTAYCAEKWGRRWITCDTSRVAITLAKQRLMTAAFDYYELAHPEEGVGSGFKYKTVPHVTLKSIANNPDIDGIHASWQARLDPIRTQLNALLKQSWEEWQIPREPEADWPEKAKALLDEWQQLRRRRQQDIDAAIARHAPQETLYDQPLVDKSKKRVSGPFTVEAVPSHGVISLDQMEPASQEADASVARSGETVRMSDWIGELQATGIRAKSGQKIEFSRIEPLGGTRYLHAEGETRESEPKRVVVSFGPAYAPLEQRQVELAIEEAQKLVPKPKIVAFASFQFDPEAAKDIDELDWPGVTVLKVQMNTDLLTADLKKKRSSNESFWLVGQPDVELEKKGDKYLVRVNGFDYYNPKTGEIESGDISKIAMWMLDTDYDGRSLYPRQIFFPMAGEKDGWSKLAKNLKVEINEEVLDELFKGNASLPFSVGKNKRIAVKIIDDRGIESLKVIEV